MRSVVIQVTGLADAASPELNGKTPLEAAVTPVLDELASRGILGLMRTVPEGDVATASGATAGILGLDSGSEIPAPGAVAAAGLDVEVPAGCHGACLDLVAVGEQESGGPMLVETRFPELSFEDGLALAQALAEAMAPLGARVHAGVGTSHVVVFGDREALALDGPPDLALGRALAEVLPGDGSGSALRGLMSRARAALWEHPVCVRLRAQGVPAPTDVWPWGAGPAGTVPAFVDHFGVRGAAVVLSPLPARGGAALRARGGAAAGERNGGCTRGPRGARAHPRRRLGVRIAACRNRRSDGAAGQRGRQGRGHHPARRGRPRPDGGRPARRGWRLAPRRARRRDQLERGTPLHGRSRPVRGGLAPRRRSGERAAAALHGAGRARAGHLLGRGAHAARARCCDADGTQPRHGRRARHRGGGARLGALHGAGRPRGGRPGRGRSDAAGVRLDRHRRHDRDRRGPRRRDPRALRRRAGRRGRGRRSTWRSTRSRARPSAPPAATTRCR